MNEKQSIIKFFQRGKVKYETTTNAVCTFTRHTLRKSSLFLYLGLLSKLDARYKLTYPIVDTAVSRLVPSG